MLRLVLGSYTTLRIETSVLTLQHLARSFVDRHYLEYYGRISPRLASRDPKFTTFETSAMQIEYGKPGNRKTWTYKFQPPMYAGQARKRLEAMHQECRTGLGLVSAGPFDRLEMKR